MENKVEELLDKISGHLKEMTKTETIIGEEFTMGEYLCKIRASTLLANFLLVS